jgi:hypothetical protein
MLKQMIIALSLVGATVAANAQDKAVYGKAAVGKVQATSAIKGANAGNVASTIVITSTHTREVGAYGKAGVDKVSPTGVIKGTNGGNVASTVVITKTHTREINTKASQVIKQR